MGSLPNWPAEAAGDPGPAAERSMGPFAGRRIVLAVSGGIAAYKAVEICRRLVDAGAHVTPVLTDAARRFVGEVTFSALASERARLSLFDDEDPIPHVTLGRQADLILVCPATARVIGAYAAGLADDLLSATLLATRAPVVVCPAMHTEMWEHPATQDNLRLLSERGVTVVAPEEGRLAGGDVGAGRLAAPESILAAAAEALATGAQASTRDMIGLRVLVTAGGTREPIDPVRFVGNRSSGKQGYAVATEAAARGAKVTLVATVRRPLPESIELVLVETAEEMRAAVGRPAPRRRGRHGRRRRRLPADRTCSLTRSRRPARRAPSVWSRPPTSSPSWAAGERWGPWWASPPRPATCSPTPRPSCAPRAPTSSSSTTSRRRARASTTTPTR